MKTECMFSSSKPRDLLLGFSSDEAEDSDEIELGLSLGGCFNSSDHKNRILRTSSIPAVLPCEILPLFPLFRSCSVPEEEMQIMARIEGKRKRDLEEKGSLKVRRIEGNEEGIPASGFSFEAVSRWRKGVAPASNGSAGLDFESRAGQGFELYGFKHESQISFMRNSEHNNHKAPTFSPFSTTPISKRINNDIVSNNKTLLRKSDGERCLMKEMSLATTKEDELNKSMMKEMPLVSTKGDGPNGRRIKGFLYKYGKGEEVRILCVCHGNFLTPAEFVKHAGGGEVAHPLRHIVVNPNPAALL